MACSFFYIPYVLVIGSLNMLISGVLNVNMTNIRPMMHITVKASFGDLHLMRPRFNAYVS